MYKFEVHKLVSDDDSTVTYKSYAFPQDEESKRSYFEELKRIIGLHYDFKTDAEFVHADIIPCFLMIIEEFDYLLKGIYVDQWCLLALKNYQIQEDGDISPSISVEFYSILDGFVDAHNIAYHINKGDIENFIVKEKQ